MIISPDKSLHIDPVVYDIIKHIKTDVALVPVTRLENFEFNEELKKLDKYIIFDYSEDGWNWNRKETSLFGKNAWDVEWDKKNSSEWLLFGAFVKEKPPSIYFKRELLSKDATKTVKPIQYPAWNEIPPIVSKEEFDNRGLEVHYSWGLSHEARKTLHGNIWLNAGKYGYSVCDNPYHLNGFFENDNSKHKWFIANVPHYARLPMEEIIKINGHAKLSVSMPGAGVCCFRHAESPLNSVMVLWEDEIEWSYPWVHNVNCIRVEPGKEIEGMIEALNNPNLYEIYKAGIENCKKYYIDNYIKNYIEPLINSI